MKLNFREGIFIEIGGELGRYNTLPVDDLVKIAASLQSLVLSLAQFNLSTNTAVDLSNFKIELKDFQKGSAVPCFAFTQRVALTISDVQVQRDSIVEQFSQLMAVSDSSDYMKLQESLPLPVIRNEIVEKLYNFTNSFGNSPAKIVNYLSPENVEEIYCIHRLKAHVKDKLITKIEEPSNIMLATVEEGVAKIEIRTKAKKITSKIVEIYKDQEASLSCVFTEIAYLNTIYHLHSPLLCSLSKDEDYYIIKNDMLDIVSAGVSRQEAEMEFFQDFDYSYRRYNSIDDSNLSERIVRIKSIINNLVISISQKDGSPR